MNTISKFILFLLLLISISNIHADVLPQTPQVENECFTCMVMRVTFTKMAEKIIYEKLNLSPQKNYARALTFFIDDTTKLFSMLLIMIYMISFLRAGLDVVAVRHFLTKAPRFAGYSIASFFGAITPFCSCSSIPLFLGFSRAGIPVGITMAFLITSPMVNELSLILLWALFGWKFTVVYITIGIGAGIIGGFFLDRFKKESLLKDSVISLASGETTDIQQDVVFKKMNLKERNRFAISELVTILGRIWKWIFVGTIIGAIIHGFLPDLFIANIIGSQKMLSVPIAAFIGIPIYSNASGIIPIVETLLQKGMPIGTTLAFMMSTVTISFPEFVLLKQVMKWKLIFLFLGFLFLMFILSGFIFNISEAVLF